MVNSFHFETVYILYKSDVNYLIAVSKNASFVNWSTLSLKVGLLMAVLYIRQLEQGWNKIETNLKF